VDDLVAWFPENRSGEMTELIISAHHRPVGRLSARVAATWSSLWYCSRDGLVFKEDDRSVCVPVERIQELY
jgi:hypothetical protein